MVGALFVGGLDMPVGQYVFVRNENGFTQSAAHALAIAKSGHLAAVTTLAEDNLIKSILQRDSSLWNLEPRDGAKNGPWIGLIQPTGSSEPAGGWSWTSGETYSFTAWHSGQPDNFIGDTVGFYWDFGGAVGWGDHVNNPVAGGYGAIKSAAIEFSTTKSSLTGTVGHDFIWCSGIDNNVRGSGGADIIEGNGGKDALYGGSGADRIRGGAGADEISGGTEIDVLSGGAGSDDFNFTSLTHSGVTSTTRDAITDFKFDVDDIDVSVIDAMVHGSGHKFSFVGAAAFTSEGQIRATQSGAHTIVSFNTDGSGGAEMQIVLRNVLATNLDAGDFIL